MAQLVEWSFPTPEIAHFLKKDLNSFRSAHDYHWITSLNSTQSFVHLRPLLSIKNTSYLTKWARVLRKCITFDKWHACSDMSDFAIKYINCKKIKYFSRPTMLQCFSRPTMLQCFSQTQLSAARYFPMLFGHFNQPPDLQGLPVIIHVSKFVKVRRWRCC